MDTVEIIDVAARDGLQSDPTIPPTEVKVELITRLIDAGVRRLEATSFVHPTRVPQMADAEAVMAAVPRRDDVTYIGLVLNERGFDRALAAGVDEVNAVVVVTESFSQSNQAMSTEDAIDAWAATAARARQAGLSTSVTLSASFGCPFEGEVAVERLVDVARRVAEHQPDEIALADSVGAAVPTDVHDRVGAVREVVGNARLRAHFHDTRNTGIANVAAAVQAGVGVIDASLGGVGGCPFAPGATGNIATEDVTFLLHRMGIATGLDLPKLIDASRWFAEELGHPLPGMLTKAGPFPKPAST